MRHDRALQRQPYAQTEAVPDAEARRAGAADEVHLVRERAVVRERPRVRPVGEMHRPRAGQSAIELLRENRQQGRENLATPYEDGVEDVERVVLRLRVLLFPEPVAASPDVPVGQNVHEDRSGSACLGDVVP